MTSNAKKANSRVKNHERWREAIDTTYLLKRLVKHVNGELKKPLDNTQLQAARILLDKTLPNLKATELTGTVEFKQFMVEHEADTKAGTD